MRHLYTTAFALALAACSGDMVSPDGQPQFSKGGKGGTSSQAAIVMSGAMGPMTAAAGGEVLASQSTKQFSNLTLKNVRLTLPDQIPEDARGVVSEANDCGGFPLRTKVTDAWYDAAGGWDVRGDWIGELTIWQEKNQTHNSNIRFAGVDANGSGSEIQFTGRSTRALQYQDGTSTFLELANLPVGFGAGPNRIVPMDDNDLPIIFCLNVAVRADAR